MRYIAVVMAVVVLSWVTPVVDMASSDVTMLNMAGARSGKSPLHIEPITTTSLEKTAPHWQAIPASLEAGRETLVFTVLPREIRQPILPDIPEPIGFIEPDHPPNWLTDMARVSWARDPIPASLQQVTANMLNVRSGPSPSATIVASLEYGDRATITGDGQSGWLPIRSRTNGVEGWVFGRYLSPAEG